jgi:RND family efflux transporter MFP subunit
MTTETHRRLTSSPRSAVWIGAAVVLVRVVVAWLAGLRKIRPGFLGGRPESLSNQPTEVVLEQTVPVVYDLVGTVQSITPIEASSRVAARVVAVPVHAGQRVRRGAVLVRLDSADLQAQVVQASGALGAAHAELVRSQADYDRFSALLKKGSVTPHEYDRAAATYRAALGNFKRASAAVAGARAALAYVTVRAPVDGVVVERLVEPGDMALPGQVLVRLYDESALRIEIEAPEDLARQIPLGTPLKITIGRGGPTFATRINEIVPAADPGTRSLRLRAPIPSQGSIKPGMFVQAELSWGSEKILTIKRAAVRIVGQLATVRVLSFGAIQLRAVSLGRTFNDRVEVLAGLRAGDRVIDSAPNTLSDASQ